MSIAIHLYFTFIVRFLRKKYILIFIWYAHSLKDLFFHSSKQNINDRNECCHLLETINDCLCITRHTIAVFF